MQQVLIAEGITALGKVREADGGDLVEVWTGGWQGPRHAPHGHRREPEIDFRLEDAQPCCRYLSGT